MTGYPVLIFYLSLFIIETAAFLPKSMCRYKDSQTDSVAVTEHLTKIYNYKGKFCAKIISIYPMAEVAQDIIETDVEIVKINKYHQGVQGCMNIKRNVGPVSAKLKSKVKASGRYVNMLLDQMNTDNVCTSESFSKFLGKYNETFYNDDCVFQKGFTCLVPPFDMNATIHEYMDEIMYGEFLFHLWFQAEGRNIMGYDILIELKDSVKCK